MNNSLICSLCSYGTWSRGKEDLEVVDREDTGMESGRFETRETKTDMSVTQTLREKNKN